MLGEVALLTALTIGNSIRPVSKLFSYLLLTPFFAFAFG
jgi:hypothetical protein